MIGREFTLMSINLKIFLVFGPEELLEGRLKQECYDEDCSHRKVLKELNYSDWWTF